MGLFYSIKSKKSTDLFNGCWSIIFLLKFLIGCVFLYYFLRIQHRAEAPSDAYRFLEESLELRQIARRSIADYLSLLTGFGNTQELTHVYLKSLFVWNSGEGFGFNESRNLIRLHSLIQFISFGNPYIHLIVFNVITLIGLQKLFSGVRYYTKLPRYLTLGILVLFPAILFWTSGILKESMLFTGLCFLFYSITPICKTPNVNAIIGSLLLVVFKPYILFCLLPAFLYLGIQKFFLKQRELTALGIVFILGTLALTLSSNFRQKITEKISRKQFDMINVGEGGLHAYTGFCYYYFTPDQYKTFTIFGDSIQLRKSVSAYQLDVSLQKKPFKIKLNPPQPKWLIHLQMPGTKSYFKVKRINNSFGNLIKTVPEALINAFFRPFPFEKGSKLKYLALVETCVLTCLLIIALLFPQKSEKSTILALLLFAFFLLLLIGWTTPISGAIVRFRMPAQLSLLILCLCSIDYKRILNHRK